MKARNVEHRVDLHDSKKYKFVSHFTYMSNNRERTHETWSELHSLNALQGVLAVAIEVEEDSVTGSKVDVGAVSISVGLHLLL
ncbi:hypothetical protein Fmac_008189 [Flemingia macrophylla]|uniref:Uncharacterized protein n=1 Tax=Flemingia macrophylla TaxID=520843 RepID=A0ABD1MWP8_9FABA